MEDNANFPLDSFSTAVALIPPEHIQARINGLRNGNDKSYPRWTAHFTLLFPFVTPNLLQEATEHLRRVVSGSQLKCFQVKLDHTDTFAQHNYDTVYLAPSASSAPQLRSLWIVISEAFKYKGRQFVPHLTLGQAASNQTSREFLHNKGQHLIQGDLTWEVSSVAVLVKDELHGGHMKLFSQVDLPSSTQVPPIVISPSLPTVRYDGADWTSEPLSDSQCCTSKFSIGTYNVMYDPRYSFSSRLAGVLEIILAANCDILCLQEVTDDILEELLSLTSIRERYVHSSRDPRSAMENCRNVVVLAKTGFPFSWSTLTIGAKQKPATLATFTFENAVSFSLASIHLSAGHFPDLEQRKLLEFQTLIDRVKTEAHRHPVIIAGDSNFLNSFRPHNCGVDVWDRLYPNAEEAEGDTFDPMRNPLAAPPDRFDRSAKRYDRIWLLDETSHGQLHPVEANVLGKEHTNASDHYLLSATFELSEPKDRPVQPTESLTTILNVPSTGSFSVADLEDFCMRSGYIPSTEEDSRRTECFVKLRQCLTGHLTAENTGLRFVVQPVGSFALGTHSSQSDLDCTVVGNLPPSTFWQYILERIQIHQEGEEKVIQVIRFIKDAAVKVLELLIDGIKMDVQYCCAPGLVGRWDEVATASPNDPMFLLPAPSLRTLNAYRDNLAILAALPEVSLPSFRLAHRALRAFCRQKGIFSGRLAYLSSIHLTIMLAREALRQGPLHVSAVSLIQGFFETYSSFSWDSSEVAVPGFPPSSSTRSQPSPMTIWTLNRPQINSTANIVQPTLAIIQRQFALAFKALGRSSSWSEICGGSQANSMKLFLSDYDNYVRIKIHHWGRDIRQGYSLVGYTESQLAGLLSQLHLLAPSVRFHLWPGQFCEGSDNQDDLTVDFIVGLDMPLPSAALTHLQSFATRIHSSERYYDSSSSYLSVEIVPASELARHHLKIPGSILLSDEFVIDAESDSEEDSEDASDEQTFRKRGNASDPLWDPDTFSFSKEVSRRQHKSKTEAKRRAETPHIPAAKLRTSNDVYNRLMWDSGAGDPNNFAIGYEDRFSGIQEIALSSWKRDVSDREFIPFHRIVYFRRKNDDCIVWDKRTKRDLVFGSGLQT